MLRKASAVHALSVRTGAPLDEVEEMRELALINPTRRQIFCGLSAAAATLAAARRGVAANTPRVAIVGGGIAGLTCARELWRRGGIAAQVYEWNVAAGGRIQTLRGYFANGQTTEQHGEFISSEHSETLKLAKHFGLEIENTYRTPQNSKDTAWFNGVRYTQRELNRDWRDFGWKLFHDAAREVGNVNYRHYSNQAKKLDNTSVAEWIDDNVPGGLPSPFGKLCYADVLDEYGGPPEKQSAVNLIYLLGLDASRGNGNQPRSWPELGGSDEKWHIRGGNDQLITGLVSELPAGTINLDYRLEALRENASGSFTASFATAGRSVDVVTDHVVLALPFTTLRNVDMAHVTLSALKRQAIASLPLGNNVKIHVQVAGRPWVPDGYNGDQLSDMLSQSGWDASSYQNQTRKTEIYGCLPGGTQGLAIGPKYGLSQDNYMGPAPIALVDDTLASLEPIFPGMTAAWNAGPKLAWVNDGNLDPHLLGAWSQYNVGQYTSFGGSEGLRQGNIHFAGEHTSFGFQGYIEGAVRSGIRVAKEILGS